MADLPLRGSQSEPAGIAGESGDAAGPEPSGERRILLLASCAARRRAAIFVGTRSSHRASGAAALASLEGRGRLGRRDYPGRRGP